MLLAGLLTFALAGCSATAGSETRVEAAPAVQAAGGNDADGALQQTGWTEAVPAAYKQPSERPGSVERIDYDSLDYAGDGRAVTKTAYVYTPYGYDAG